MTDGVVKKGVILKRTPEGQGSQAVSPADSVETGPVATGPVATGPVAKGPVATEPVTTGPSLSSSVVSPVKTLSIGKDAHAAVREEPRPKIIPPVRVELPFREQERSSSEKGKELSLESLRPYWERGLTFLKTPNSPSQQVAIAFTVVFAICFVAIPRFHTEGRSLRSSLMTYNEIEDRLLPEESEEIVEVDEDGDEEPRESPLKLLLDDLEDRMRTRGRGTRVVNLRQPSPKISKSKAVAVMKTLAYNHPKVPLRPGTQEFDKVRQQVLKVIRSHSRKGTDVARLASEIVSESWSQQYDPLFVAAVIKSESAFNTFATSHVGAKGLMQIMPDTGKYVADISGMPRGSLTDPGYNLKLGIKYLKYLENMFEGNRVLTLIAYNWGPGHLTRTMKGEKRGVPRAVMNYALKILGDHSRWVNEAFGRA